METTDTGESTGLQFFGKISAAVTHDLKNNLSIINESAGLLEDFCVMAQRGQDIDMGRIAKVAGQVKGQVEKADRIIRSFNRFAHSVDHPVAPTDVGEMVVTLVQLAQRLLANAGVSAVVRPPEPPVVIATRPLLAQLLIWSGIQWAVGCGRQHRNAYRRGGIRGGGIGSDRALGGPARGWPRCRSSGIHDGRSWSLECRTLHRYGV